MLKLPTFQTLSISPRFLDIDSLTIRSPSNNVSLKKYIFNMKTFVNLNQCDRISKLNSCKYKIIQTVYFGIQHQQNIVKSFKNTDSLLQDNDCLIIINNIDFLLTFPFVCRTEQCLYKNFITVCFGCIVGNVGSIFDLVFEYIELVCGFCYKYFQIKYLCLQWRMLRYFYWSIPNCG